MSVSTTSDTAEPRRRRMRAFMRAHRPTAIAVTLAAGFLVANMALALGQWDRHRITFAAEPGVEVALDAGEQRIIYMTADESETLNFDFYPSDFDCTARGPGGEVTVRPVDHRRLLDLWRRHWSIGAIAAEQAGRYRIACDGKGVVPLVLAAPARFNTRWANPTMGLAFFVLVVVGAGITQITIAFARWVRRRTLRDLPEGFHD